ncbi:MAG TPA: helix-turn-helix domain-containing protein [Thermomicrobiaceae bacterium]|nr:helix-turn-helix domain-containing protein [Thermomicrobiaceae bacterium]
MRGEDRPGWGYTVEEAAEILQYHPDTLRYWLRVGQLGGLRRGDGDEWLIELDALLAFLRQCDEPVPIVLALAS